MPLATDETSWALLHICDKHFASDLASVLDEAVVPHRTRPAAADDTKVLQQIAFTGMPTSFGAASEPQFAVEVPASDLARARVLLEQHQQELERAASIAAGVAPATSDELAADARWMDERRGQRRSRTLVRLALPFAGIVIAAVVAAMFTHRHDGEEAVGPLQMIREYGDVEGEGTALTLHIDPRHGKLAALSLDVDGKSPFIVGPAKYLADADIYIEHASPDVGEWIDTLAAGKTEAIALHGRAVTLGELGDRGKLLRALYQRNLKCPGGACSPTQLDARAIFLVE